MTTVLHANWSDGLLHIWGEDAQRVAPTNAPAAPIGDAHPFASANPRALLETLMRACDAGDAAFRLVGNSELRLRLPCALGRPLPSNTLAHTLGRPTASEEEVESETPPPFIALETLTVPTAALQAEGVLPILLPIAEMLADSAALDATGSLEVEAGAGLLYYAQAARLARHLLAQQRFVPMLVQTVMGDTKGAWHPWMSDEATAARVSRLIAAMPPAARAAADHHRHEAWAITDEFLSAVTDAACRDVLWREDFATSIANKPPAADPHIAWLSALLVRDNRVPGAPAMRQDMIRRVRGWVGVLEERGASSAWRLMLRLTEPVPTPGTARQGPDAADALWIITFHLQSVDQPGLVLDAPDVWLLKGDSASVMGRRIDRPQELLLGELGRASRFYKPLEESLEEAQPQSLVLDTRKAYEFLREVRPILMEQGVAVEAPSWWDSPSARLGAKLKLESDELDPLAAAGAGLTNAARAQLGLGALVSYKWEIAVGDTTLSLHEFEQLASKRMPLVRINGRWVEIRPEDVHAAIKFIRDNPGGQIKLGEAMRLAYGSDLKTTGIPVVGLEASGWLAGFLNSESASKQLDELAPAKSFRGTLRPYQARGVSWMAFQEQLGFGVCLADDMGLGKTVQLLALMAWEREKSGEANGVVATAEPAPVQTQAPAADGASNGTPDAPAALTGQALHGVAPTLLLVPMSVVGNWMHETKRFCPHLRVLVHHGITRKQNEEFLEAARASDLIITTYALAHRDRDLLKEVKWGRIVLDEAQYIKNPAAKQSQAVRSLEAGHRVALTGTPVENRLTELWSIMDFLNPGYLGSSGNFRTRFAVPIERYRDKAKSDQLRGLIRPFVLRRLKSDPTVVADLPEKLETREFSHLTSEQASLYESCVKRMLSEVDEAEGMQRRGLVLSALIRLKQICNHPSLVLKDSAGSSAPDPTRSGKCIRILDMLEEVLSEGDQSLVFTQFREMGHLLEAMIRHRFQKDVLFIHGGTTQPQRQAMVERFQKADGTAPVLLLSLRAGGVGLNLTAATHVFHFDRWWNPAVENQATDRAYRIGQTRTVQVHKFVIRGTLEERIDQMIESKTELAENIIGAGEQWLSELNTDQLRDILTLRNDAVDDEA